jgi:arylsulfatase A-like enzyme
MSAPLNRRDFLRLSALLPFSVAAPRWSRRLSGAAAQQNVIVVVFDAWSALNVSLYGYARATTPNLARLAERAVVYHNHYAGSSFTTSGTASLLTGTYPWTHHALAKEGQMAPSFADRSIFGVFDDYYRISYSHNPVAYILLNQLRDHINDLTEPQKLLLRSYDGFLGDLFRNDGDISNVGWVRDAKLLDGYAYSLFVSHFDALMQNRQEAELAKEFPGGSAPWVGGRYFRLEDAVDQVVPSLQAVSQPFFGYFHFLPPHAPYRPPLEFSGHFHEDEYIPLAKPRDEFAREHNTQHGYKRVNYDEFILYVDQQFARLHDQLERSGLLDNTWLVLTSDHGEMFERGITGHMTDVFYQPVVRVPLVIFEPGRQQALDVRTPSSAVDLLPTLAQVTGHALPPWTEGTVLPPYTAEPDPSRSRYALRATNTQPGAPVRNGSTMIVRGNHKLIYYFGYGDTMPDHARLFDLDADPEELNDLFSKEKTIASTLLDELKTRLDEANRAIQH